ncbi:AbrB/MazE/SpoVT family DNA-binding domain-containing protein [Actimicrobium sp. CCI2.3]|uniref:AbrB/MazE/SpoVT family DNA-binding domain-containing protein n=1 Tax=Actimicrobium sp. CCI2.3 TaxID=3048616 RepID=UPI002B24A6DD|nr:AbrB/MazE/SpoVT family DNA-binding domain-containing protein [Actimicrobium sp. CCI2.3]MEB0023794.1 AbrB/MazE/SpoVT family DNA-binding domain-containing protein [Actimicrobium sp. CCI2.3]
MRTVAIFISDKNQAIRFLADMSCDGVEELEITRIGDTITLQERQSVISDESRFNL